MLQPAAKEILIDTVKEAIGRIGSIHRYEILVHLFNFAKVLFNQRANLLKEEDSPTKKILLEDLENRIKQQESLVESWKKSPGETIVVPEELNKNLYGAQNKLDVAKLQEWIASYKEWINTAEGSKYIFDQLSAGNEIKITIQFSPFIIAVFYGDYDRAEQQDIISKKDLQNVLI
ncbi:MAG: hypothetical protein JSS81_18555 [Acidobacteria bacterium]|nr:hypothetical protein [Acidobacteriota bacterium]